MKKYATLLTTFALFATMGIVTVSCNRSAAPKTDKVEEIDADTIPLDADQYVRMETSEGDIVLKLYRETPRHRHNFVKLAQKGYYDGQTFYRIVNNSLIQAGDPNSKNATKETKLGTGDVDFAAAKRARKMHKGRLTVFERLNLAWRRRFHRRLLAAIEGRARDLV